MKKTYLLIVDLFFIDNKIFLSHGLTSLVNKLSGISVKGGEYGLIKAIKKPVFSKLILVLLTGLLSLSTYAQTYKTFSIREKIDIRGKMIVAGNNILGKDNLPFNDNTVANQDIPMQYIDIDGDSSTFSSSSADLSVPPQKDGSATTCYRVAYAALYWGAMLQSGSRTDINKVKLKLPGATTYNDINGEVIYDAVVNPIIPDANTPYACYANVTALLAGLTDLSGTYTVANVTSSIGTNGSTGLSAGWTLFVVYEDPSLHMKSFSVFDGFSHVYSSHFEKIPVTGFITPPSGNIDLQFAYAALDGDKPQGGTKLEFGTKQVVTPLRPANNFFISTIENTNGVSTPRNPFGSNTLGYDTGVLEVIGADPEYINNNQTSTDFTLQVAKGLADPVFVFFSAYAVDIIAPKIDLTKLVKNTSGVDIGGGNVTLGQSLTYEISYQSVGNDNVQNFTIKDVLPINITFDPTTNIDYTNAGGATLQSYDPVTRTIIFNIPNTSVEVNDGIYTIRLNIQVVPDCNSLTTACSNVIKNQAFATYQGVINTNVFQEEGSFASTACKLGSPESTNFLVDISNCKFTQNVILCGSSVVLKASDGYSTYSWSRNPDGSSPIGSGQTFTATQIGVYYVHNTAPSTCKDIVEEITVKYFGVTNTNPVIPYAQSPYLGEVVTCPDDGKQLPNLFLCGANDSRVIQTGISDAASIEWYKLNEGSCVAVVNPDCANENPSCTWTLVGTGPDFTANISGQFRLTIKYPGGCFSQFYFNVYQNLLNPTVTSKDILCTTSGQITVGGVPSGYEYSLNYAGPYQSSNVFPNASFPVINAGSYTVYIKQVGVTANPCIFSVPDILIRKRDFTVSTILTQPLCKGDKGTVKLIANDALPQYYFSISQGATLVNSVGPIIANEYQFSNLNPGVYTVRVWTDDGCDYSNSVEIIEPVLLTATAALTKPLTCTDGEITVYPVGGTAPYIYYVNSTTVFQSTPQIAVTNPLPVGGIYNIVIEDSNNCTATTSIAVAAILPPVYTMSQTDIKCYNDNIGVINFNVTNANGYTLAYSIDNGVTYLSTPTFSNLFAGIYNTIVRYTLGTAVCYGTMQVITITQPSTALTASAGVSELAGCGPLGEGKIRITNPQGGTAPYEYSFDNQATWTTVNDAFMAPGTYTVYIKDANGCIYAMPNIIIDPKPVEPTIDVASPIFNCDGTATSTVTVTNNGGANYSYQYLLDGVPNTNVPSNIFTNVPSGTHTVSVSYKLLSVPTYSNLLKEDFGYGDDTTSPGINTTYYCFERQVIATQCKGSTAINDGDYSVTAKIVNPFGAWIQPTDHTTPTVPATPKGRFLVVNIGATIPKTEILYEKNINNIIPNQPINFEFFAMNLLNSSNTQYDPDLLVALVDGTGTEISSFNTGNIPKSQIWENYPKTAITLNPGSNTSLKFIIRSNVQQTSGNDVAIDDITVYQLPKSCITTKDFTVIIPTDEAFTASITGFKNVSCAGANNGEITIAAQNFDSVKGFQYSIDNGVTWVTQMTSPYTITGLADATYNLQIRYDATSTGTCVKTFSQIITAPTPLTVTASVTTAATCSAGATITAIGAGGTLAYQYELRDAAGVVVIRPYQLNAQFTNVPTGNYTVFVKDTNLCISAVGAAINIVAPPTLTATLDASSDICFDSVNQASLIVNASGGTPPFTYSLNGAPAQNSNTFTNVGTGTHNIVVTDSYNCTATINNIGIAPQLIAVANITKTLDCTASPNAVITGTIFGGTAPYIVTLIQGAGTPNVSGNTFTLTTSTSGDYQFEVTDANGCPATSGVITINPLVPVTATTTDVNPSCNGGADGSVTLVAAGGVGPYTYSFNGSPFTGTTLYSGLSAGIAYPYQVKDSKSCVSVAASVTLTAPAAITGAAVITIPYTCTQTATIQAQGVGGGTPGYTYSIDGVTFQAGDIFVGLTNGTYTITIKDSKNCTYVTPSVTIAPLTPPTDLTFSNTALSCPAKTSNVTITGTTGGSLPLQYQIIAPVATAYQASNVFSGLASGTYTFQVKDAKDCTYQESYTIAPLPALAVVGQVLNNVQCFGSSTGSVRFTVSGTTAYSYTINGGAAVPGQTASVIDLSNLPKGNYTIVVTDDTTTCPATASVAVAEPLAPLAVTTTVTPIKCNADGSVAVNATGGWGGNTYTLTQPDATDLGPQASNTFTNLTQTGDYTVSVTDANNCTITDTFTLSTPTAPTASIDVTSDLCYDSTNQATIVITPAGGQSPYQYSIDNGLSYQASNTFANLTPGNYTIIVKDAFRCPSIALAQTIAPQLTVNTVLTKDLDCTASPDAVITGTITGGYAGFTYAVSVNGGAYSAATAVVGNTFTYPVTVASVVAPTTYQFQVTDLNNCPATSGVITINPISYPVISTVTQLQQIYCFGDTTGAINVTIDTTVGTAPFVINVNNDTTGINYGTQTSGLPAGDYTITITDAKGCTDTKPITIAEPVLLTSVVTKTDITCTGAGTSLGSISGTPSGGIGPYTYNITNNVGAVIPAPNIVAGVYTFDIINFGIYELSFTDANGCTKTEIINMASPPSDLIINTTAGPASCTSASIIVSVDPPFVGGPYHFALFPIISGSNPAYDYATNMGSYQDADSPVHTALPDLYLQSTFNGLNPGVVYSFIVYDETTNCYFFKQATSPTQTTSTLTSTVTPKNVTCAGAGDGSVDLTFTNTYPALTDVSYEVFNSQTNLPLAVPITGTVIGLNGGPITSTVSNLGPLAPGTYYILFKEVSGGANNGCTNASTTFTITQSVVPLTVTATVIKNQNCIALGQISVVGQGGTAPYTYQVLPSASVAPIASDPGWVAANTFNLVAGNYIAYVKDANGCIQPTTVAIALPLDPSPVVAAALNNQCTATEGNFAIDVAVPTPGIAPYSFSIDGGAFQTQPAPFTILNLSSGTHSVEIKDVNGCGNLVSVTILAPLGMTPTITALPTCADNDGEITVSATGGTVPANYAYTLLDIASAIITGPQPGNVFSGLAAGSYQVQVTDGTTTCQVTKPVVLSAPTPVTFSTTETDVSCNGGNDGTITVTLPASNDNPVYTYEITAPIVVPAQTSNIFTGLAAGTYTVKVNSGRGCSLSQPETVGEPPVLTVSGTATPFGCAPDNSVNTSTVTITELGGIAPYTYSIDGTNYFPTNTFSVIDTGVAQTINIYAKDANGCSATNTVGILPLPTMTAATVAINSAIDCNNTGSVAITVTGGSGNFSYQLLPSLVTQPSNIFNITAPGTYNFQVNDLTTGCTIATLPYVVAPFNTIDAVATATAPVTCFGDADGAIEINVTGYTGTYNYEVFDSLGTSVTTGSGDVSILNPQPITGLLAGNYTVAVTETASPFCTKITNVATVGSPSAAVSLSFTTVNDNCNVNAGQIIAVVQGGTAPYTYQILPALTLAPFVTDPGWVASNTLNAESGNYVVYVKDANDCLTSLPATIGLDPTPVVAAALVDQCAAEGNFAIDVTVPTAGIAPYSFSIDGGAFQTQAVIPFTISNLSSGPHSVEIKDVNGCGNSPVPVTILAPLGLTSTITALPSCVDGDGTLTLLASGGSGNYDYSIDLGAYQASANFTNIFAGPHTLTVRDTTTNCTKSIPVTFGAATPITGFVLSKTDVTCNGGNDGTITATMNTPAVGVNDNPIYTYSIDGGATTQTSTIFSGLIAGTYTVDITSGRGCTATQIITVGEPAIITVPAPTDVQFGCNSGSNAMNFATITVTGVTGGSGVYTNYEFIKGGTRVQFGASNVYTEADLLGGTYTINVYDDKGCMGTAPSAITLNPFIALDKVNVNIDNAITCTNLEDITVSASSIGGTPTNLQYTLVDYNATTGVSGVLYPSQTNPTGIFTGLPVADYLITVENLDTGCSIQSVHYVSEPNTFDLTIDNIVDVTCFGGTNGSANVTFIDRVITATNPDQAGPFSYTIVDALGNPVTSGTSPTPGPLTISALAAGTYTITATLTNSPYCGATKNFTVNQPTAALAISETHTDITCVAGNNDGSIAASAVGGWPGAYEFQLELGASVVSPWSPIANFTGLTQGTYTVRARDARGCSVFVDVLLSNPTPIVFTASPSMASVSCFGDKNASITVSLPTGGQGSNYLYTLNTTSMVPAAASGPQASPTFSGLGAGTYTVTVTDGYSCSATSAPIVIAEPSVVTASLVVATTQTCNNQTTLTLSAIGGTPPYTYSADGIIYNATSFNPSVTFPVAVGTHHYYVKDSNGCTSYVSNDIKIDPLPALVIKLDLSNAVVNCTGDATGVIVATAEGGLGNYVYTLQDASGNPLAAVQSSPGVFTQLVAGGYKVQVSSLDCSATSALITVNEPSTPLIATYVATDATCNGANNGTIVINASGGTGIIKYAISPRLDQFFVSNVFELLQPGFYEIIAQDQNGCYIHTLGIEIKEPTPIIPSVDSLTIIPELCFGDNDGAFTIDITGGTMPYSVSLDKINGPFTSGTATQTQFDFTGLAGGDHIVYIRDTNLCNAEMTVPLPASVKLDPNAIIDYGCLNNSPSLTVTVTIDASITNPADVDYALDGVLPYQSSNVFTNVAPGIHHITARHTNGCEKDTPDFEILQIEPLTLVLTDGGLNEIVATTTGGAGGYKYTLNGEYFGSQNTFIFYKSGDYTVTVTDSNGCVATATRYFEFIDIKIPNVFTPNGDGDNDGWTPTNTMNYPDLLFYIFDRYGRKVGAYREGQFWDGKYNGLELPTGDYWYVIKLRNEQDSREFVGHFTLYR